MVIIQYLIKNEEVIQVKKYTNKTSYFKLTIWLIIILMTI